MSGLVGLQGWDYKYYSHLTLKDGGLDCRKIKGGGGTFRAMFIYRVYTPIKYETVKDDQKIFNCDDPNVKVSIRPLI